MSELSENRRAFAAALGGMISPLEPETAVGAIEGILSAVVSVPEAAFDRPGELASALAGNFNRVPNAAQLTKALGSWWRANAPPSVQRGSDDASLTPEDLSYLAVWLRRREAGFPLDVALANLPAAHQLSAETFRSRLATSLMVARQYWPRVFRHLCRTDNEAASIAVQRGWPVDEERRGPIERSSEEIAAVERTVADALHRQKGRIDYPSIDAQREEARQKALRGAAAATAKPPAPSPEVIAQRDASPVVQRAKAIQAAEADTTSPQWDPNR